MKDNKDTAIDYIYRLFQYNHTFYTVGEEIASVIDDYLENCYVEKMLQNLERVSNPALSHFVVSKIENNPKFKTSILKHLTFIFSSFQMPKKFGDNCSTCKKVHKFLYSSTAKTTSFKSTAKHHLRTLLSDYKYCKIPVNSNAITLTITRKENDEENVQTILSKLRKIQNRLLGNSNSKPIEIIDQNLTSSTSEIIEID